MRIKRASIVAFVLIVSAAGCSTDADLSTAPGGLPSYSDGALSPGNPEGTESSTSATTVEPDSTSDDRGILTLGSGN